MIEPNLDLLLVLILVGMLLSVTLGTLGLWMEWGKEKKYGTGDVVHIIWMVIVILLVLLY